MIGLIGRKLGMTAVFDEEGNYVPCTVIEAGPCVVVQVRTPERDGYNAVQLGWGKIKPKHVTKPMRGHFARAGVEPVRHLVEFRDFDLQVKEGDVLTVEILKDVEKVDVTGTSKGRGFQGVVKRHGFSGVGGQTHGQEDRERAPGSLGSNTDPGHVFKGKRMAGRMGNGRVTVKNLKVVRIIPEENIVLIKGSVPGHRGAMVILKARKSS